MGPRTIHLVFVCMRTSDRRSEASFCTYERCAVRAAREAFSSCQWLSVFCEALGLELELLTLHMPSWPQQEHSPTSSPEGVHLQRQNCRYHHRSAVLVDLPRNDPLRMFAHGACCRPPNNLCVKEQGISSTARYRTCQLC